MVGVMLLAEATAAGLTVHVAGDRLIVRGPKRSAGVARRLLDCKAEVVAALAAKSHDAKPNAYGSDRQAPTMPDESQVVEPINAPTAVVANDAARPPAEGARIIGIAPPDVSSHAPESTQDNTPTIDAASARNSNAGARLRDDNDPLPRARVKGGPPFCRCGSAETVDVPIHDGRSLRRDCARCRRFIDFPVWYGRAKSKS